MNDLIIPPKRCTSCGEEYPPTEEFFRPRFRNGGIKLNASCRACERAYTAKWRTENPEFASLSNKRSKAKHREKTRERERAYKKANREHIREVERAYWSTRQEYRRELLARWRGENAGYVKAYEAAYRTANKAQRTAYNTEWRKRNPDYGSVWRKGNLPRIRIYTHKRRVQLEQSMVSFTPDDWQACLSYWNRKCAICGREATEGVILAMDHWKPLSKGGETSPLNIVPLCHGKQGCNNSKGNNMPAEWLAHKWNEEFSIRKQLEIEAYFEAVRKSNA